MLTYFVLDSVVLICLLLTVFVWRRSLNWYRIAVLAAVLCVLTAVFDTLIIYEGIVAYNSQHILGIFVGKAPIEDFAYAIAVAVLVPFLWGSDGKSEK